MEVVVTLVVIVLLIFIARGISFRNKFKEIEIDMIMMK